MILPGFTVLLELQLQQMKTVVSVTFSPDWKRPSTYGSNNKIPISFQITRRYRACGSVCVGITTAEGSRKYYDVCEALSDMEVNFVSVKAVLNNLLLDAPCPYCEKEEV